MREGGAGDGPAGTEDQRELVEVLHHSDGGPDELRLGLSAKRHADFNRLQDNVIIRVAYVQVARVGRSRGIPIQLAQIETFGNARQSLLDPGEPLPVTVTLVDDQLDQGHKGPVMR